MDILPMVQNHGSFQNQMTYRLSMSNFAKPMADGENSSPISEMKKLARPWAIPGTPGLEHRVGGN
jgi:hypothetical protein